MDYKSIFYLASLGTALPLTLAVGRPLYKHGRIFLVDAFGGNEPLADSVNHLLLVGFYLINVGYVCLTIKSEDHPIAMSEMLEVLGTRVGYVLLVLGFMHFMNLFIFSRIRRRGMLRKEPPPVAPSRYVGDPQGGMPAARNA